MRKGGARRDGARCEEARRDGSRREEVQRGRAKKAALAVLSACLLFVMAVVAGCVAESRADEAAKASDMGAATKAAKGADNPKDGSYVTAIWDAISGGTNLESAVEQAGFTRMDASNAPEWFEREIAPMSLFDCVFANREWTLFELQAIGSKESVLEDVRMHMVERGWQHIPSGMEGVDTFTKSEGDIRWAMLECSEASGVCCMVLHIQQS